MNRLRFRKWVLCLFSALLLAWGIAIPVFADVSDGGALTPEYAADTSSRSIYAGDIITLEIASDNINISADELRQKFGDFEVVELTETRNGFRISLRTFETGEYSIIIGNKEIVISVASALDEIERDDIFEGGLQVSEPGLIIPWKIILYAIAAIFVLSCGCYIWIKVFGKNAKKSNPYQVFLRRAEALEPADEGFLAYLTIAFKKYLESRRQCRIAGKTSGEIINELETFPLPEITSSRIGHWLTECDRLKYSGIYASTDIKLEHYKKLLDLAEDIELQFTNAVADIANRDAAAQKDGVA